MTHIRRTITLAGVLGALALVAPGCGDSGDSGNAGGDAQATSPQTTEQRAPADAATAEQAIEDVVAKLKDGLAQGDEAAVCAVMSEAGRKATAGVSDSPGASCEQATAEVIALYGENLHESLNVVELQVDGDRATAVFKAETGNTYDTRFVEQDGEWRYDSSLVVGAN